jgi:hypothetical protein
VVACLAPTLTERTAYLVCSLTRGHHDDACAAPGLKLDGHDTHATAASGLDERTPATHPPQVTWVVLYRFCADRDHSCLGASRDSFKATLRMLALAGEGLRR